MGIRNGYAPNTQMDTHQIRSQHADTHQIRHGYADTHGYADGYADTRIRARVRGYAHGYARIRARIRAYGKWLRTDIHMNTPHSHTNTQGFAA